MDKIPLNDLPDRSNFARNLMDKIIHEKYHSQTNNRKKEVKYNYNERYKKAFKLLETHDFDLDADELHLAESSNKTDPVMSQGNEIFQQSVEQTRKDMKVWMLDKISTALSNSNSVVELGAGYGQKLSGFSKKVDLDLFWQGGEFSEEALKLSRELHKGKSNITVNYFDYFQEETYKELFNNLTPPITIFTSHSIEQLRTAQPFIENIFKIGIDNIHAVFHFEPVFEFYDNSLIGLLRKIYCAERNYNVDLYGLLSSHPGVKIIEVEKNKYGGNPLNPTSLIKWEFVG